jgi:type IV secretion system protein VirB1
MAYSAAALLALASQCAPTVAPETVLAIIQTESSGEPFTLNVNGARQPARQSNAADAAAHARRYVAAGYSVDLELGVVGGDGRHARNP